ncbi:putative reverse transcriptase domain-containing protein [Tanacetum coccineum]
MSPPRRQHYRWNIAVVTGCRRMGRMKRNNRRIRIPSFMRSYRIEEELTLVKTFGKEVEGYATKVIAKDGTVTRFEGRFPQFIEEEEEKKPNPYNLYGFLDLMENEQVYAKNSGNGNGANGGNGGNGNNRYTYKSFMSCNPKEYDGKGGVVELTRWIEKMETVIDNSGCAENQKVKYVSSSLVNKALTWWNTQVQARGREAANAMSCNDFKELLVEAFCRSNEMEMLENEFLYYKMIGANHAGYTDRFHELAKLVPHLVTPKSTRIKSAILKAEILTDEAVSNGTLTKSSKKRKSVDEPTKASGSRRDVKKAKGGTNFVAAAPSREGYAGSQPWCAKCRTHHHEKANCRLALGWRRNDRGGGNQVRGRAYNANMNAAEAAKDSSVVTGTFFINDHFATVLFDSGADFSFISTKFAPMLNVKPSIANPSYVIEIANGKKVEVDRIICGCKLQLGSSLFTIDLIPLGHGSFDVIVRMDWLSHNKAMIVCHEKVVEIPLVDGEILRVHGEHVEDSTKALKNAKVDEPKISDISMVREFVKAFPDELKGLPP